MRKEQTILLDDLTGEESEGVTTIRFGLDGVDYEIDLDPDNEKNLRGELEAYIAAGRKSGAARSGSKTKVSASNRMSREQAGAIRTWARKQGYTVPDRGRLSREVVEAFDAAH